MSSSVGSFFKVILTSTLRQGKLKIPSKFVKEHWDELYESVRLFIPTGRSWCVGIKRDIHKTIWLQDGLLKFMGDNSIGIDYFLIFEYGGNSMFNVFIFDLTATEINYIYNSHPEKCSDADQIQEPDAGKDGGDEDSKERSIEYLGSSTDHQFPQISAEPNKYASRNNRRKFVTRQTDVSKPCYLTRRKKHKLNGSTEAKNENDCFTAPRRDMSGQSYERMKKTIHSYKDQRKTYNCSGGNNLSKFKDTKKSDAKYISLKECAEERTDQAGNMSFTSSFEVTLKSFNIEKHILHVPRKFARLNIPDSSCLIKLLDADDNEWVVHCICHGANNNLTQGWVCFVKDKKLMVGDVCVFERMVGEGIILKVNIYRSPATEMNYNCSSNKPKCIYSDQTLVPNKEGSGDEDSKGKSIEFGIGSSTDHIFPQISKEPSKYSSRNKQRKYVTPETDDIKQCYVTRIKKQKLNVGTEAKIADFFTPPLRDTSRQSYKRIHKTSSAYKDVIKTYNCPGGKNSSMFKDTRTSDGRYVSPKECAEGRADQAENMSFPASFEVTLKTYNLEKHILNVPQKFAKLNMPHSSSYIKFLDVEDNEWVVHWNCHGRNHNLTKGWIRFARDKKLMVGDVCVFERMGGSDVKLKVNIYRSEETNYTCSSNSPKCSYSDQIQVPETGECGGDEGRQTYICGSNSSKYKDTKNGDGSYPSPKEYDDKRTDQAECISSLTSFEVTMKTYNIGKRIVTVPKEFARLNLPRSTSFIKLLDADDNEWLVRWIRHGIQNTLSQGWIHFVRDKKLMVGDVCIFERIEGGEVKLKVNIYRSADMNNSVRYKDIARDDGPGASPSDLVKERTIEAENKSGSLLCTDMKNSIMNKDTARDASPSDLVKERTIEAENKSGSLLCTDMKNSIMNKDTARDDGTDASLGDLVKERTIEAENKSDSLLRPDTKNSIVYKDTARNDDTNPRDFVKERTIEAAENKSAT